MEELGRLPLLSRERDFSRSSISWLQLVLYVQASEFACLPGRSYRCKFPCRAAEAFTSEQNVHRYPLHASDMLSARLQAIGGARTLTSQDSQHCRLLLLQGCYAQGSLSSILLENVGSLGR